jgi:hypothetical protein
LLVAFSSLMRRAYPASLCFQELIEIISEGFFTASNREESGTGKFKTVTRKLEMRRGEAEPPAIYGKQKFKTPTLRKPRRDRAPQKSRAKT